MAMTKKAKKIMIISAASVMTVILLAVTGVLLWLFVFNKTEPVSITYFDLNVDMADELYFGNRVYDGESIKNNFSIDKMLGVEAAEISVPENDTASYSGGVLTVDGEGTFAMTVDGKTKNVTIVDAINAVNFAEFARIIQAGEAIVLQSDIVLEKGSATGYTVKANVYGNGHSLLCEAVVGVAKQYFTTIFEVDGKDIVIQDLKMVGRAPEKDKAFPLEELDTYGQLISFNGAGVKCPTGTIKNCILENANRLLFANNANVTVEGCILRNAADSCISIETNNDGVTVLNLTNNVLMYPVVAGVQVWGYAATKPENHAVINIEGFLDIYNWKERTTAAIVPRSEGSAFVVNPIIKEQLALGENDKYFYNYKEKQYLHLGILVMATSELKQNDVEVYGEGYDGETNTEGQYSYRPFPLPTAAAMFINVCKIYGYENKPYLEPDAKFSDNLNIFKELREGRVAA